MLENISVKLTAIYEKYIPLSEIDHLKMILGFQNILHQAGLFVIIFMISALFVVICTFSALLCSAPIRELIVFAAASQALTLIPDAGHPHHPRPH